MTQNLVICRFLEHRYMILNLCTFLGHPAFRRTQGQVNSVGPWHQSLLNWTEIWMWPPPLGLRVSLLKVPNVFKETSRQLLQERTCEANPAGENSLFIVTYNVKTVPLTVPPYNFQLVYTWQYKEFSKSAAITEGMATFSFTVFFS